MARTILMTRTRGTGGELEKVRIDLKKNDMVKVIAGRDKGKSGRVLSVNRKSGTILVEHVAMLKRHTRPNPAKQIKGGIAEREGAISPSNVMIICPGCHKTVRVAHKVEVTAGKRHSTRVCRKCGAVLDRKG